MKIIKIKTIKLTKYFYIWAAASIICMTAIFWFSSRTAEESGGMSSSLTHNLFGFVNDWETDHGGGSDTAAGADNNISNININIMETLEMIVRKTAHFVIYFALGFFVANTVRQLTSDKKYIFFIALGWSSFYAATDELHQYFVPGRSCMWQDWAIDTVGALCGVTAVFIVVRIIEKIKKREISDVKINKIQKI